jgi:hypothetical protein
MLSRSLQSQCIFKCTAKLQKKIHSSKFHGKKSLHSYFVVFAAAKRPQMSWSKLCYEAVIALLLHNQNEISEKGKFAFSEIAHARDCSNLFGSPLTQSRFCAL